MDTHFIMPIAPLVLRTGKPFGETGGDDTYSFPIPSTVAGALRTAHADAEGLDFEENKSEILGWTCHGALPAELSDGTVKALFVRPGDCYYIKRNQKVVLQRLAPSETNNGEGCDLPPGLLPAFAEAGEKSKPVAGELWWTETSITNWLLGEAPEISTLGHFPPPVDMRSHVVLDPITLAARPGQLFRSAGPDFEACRRQPTLVSKCNGWEGARYGLLARFSHTLRPTFIRLGGEGRLAHVSPSAGWPDISPSLNDALESAKRLRLILATPALFSKGWRPGWLDDKLLGHPPAVPGLKLRLRAAVLDRWEAISGWDMVARKPKSIRRSVPAGAVYWFDIVDAPTGWVKQLWLSSISDGAEDQNNGFGLVLPGLWK